MNKISSDKELQHIAGGGSNPADEQKQGITRELVARFCHKCNRMTMHYKYPDGSVTCIEHV